TVGRIHLAEAISYRIAGERLSTAARTERGVEAPQMLQKRRCLASKAIEQRGREIALGKGRNDHNYILPSILLSLADLDSSGQCCAGGDAKGHAFEPGDFAGKVQRLGAAYRNDLVVDMGVEDCRREACADALDLVRSRLA